MATHQLTEKAQGKYHYTIGPYTEPVLKVRPGDTIVVETRDAFEGKIKDEKTRPSKVLEVPFLNPQSGPIYVEGAAKGDALAVRSVAIRPRGPRPRGTCCLIPYCGGLAGTDVTAALQDPLPDLVRKVHITEEEGTGGNDRIAFPYEPFIGTIGTSPQIDSINSLTAAKHGGNMDLADVCPGATIYFPVKVDGALLYLGDGHAVQGDGEVCGVAIEFATTTTITVNLVKGWELAGPRLEKEQCLMCIGTALPTDNSFRIAIPELGYRTGGAVGSEKRSAYFILSQVGKV